MISPELLAQLYERTHWVIVKQTEGLTHSDSLLQLPFRSNCLNWVLGHIIVHRDKVLEMLGERPILSEGEKKLYEQGSEPITEGEPAVSLERLLKALEETQERIVATLKQVTADRLEARAEEGRERTVGERLEFLQWHETYHSGQLEILRQLAGKNDAII